MKRIIEFLRKLFCNPIKLPSQMKKKSSSTGLPFSMAKIREFVGNFKKQFEGNKTLEEAFTDQNGLIREAEFFGKDKLNLLLKPKKNGKDVDILGVRIYYGFAPEDENGNIVDGGRISPRLFLVPVGLDGNDITFDHAALKDDPDGDGLGDGTPQPPYHD